MKREHKGEILLALATYTEADEDVEGLYEQYRELLGVDDLTARQGHYAARRDLQKHFSIRGGNGDYYVTSVTADDFALGSPSQITDGDLAHFGVSREEWGHIFGEFGCDRARTPIQAARYIERFVKGKS